MARTLEEIGEELEKVRTQLNELAEQVRRNISMVIDVNQAAKLLRAAYDEAPRGERTLGIRLFGIKYADELQELTSGGSSVSTVVEELVRKAQPLGKSKKGDYSTEVQKGMKLAKYVSLKDKDLWF